jgi:hypothetical protein
VKMVGMITMKMRLQMELHGIIIILKLVVGGYAAALGSIIRGIVVLRFVTTTLAATATSVFESFPPRMPSPSFALLPFANLMPPLADRFFFRTYSNFKDALTKGFRIKR